ncbi:MAG: PDZ domain-containing protein [Acidimicrobiia bacterium]
MSRSVGLVLSALVIAACSGQVAPPRTPLPDAGLVVPEPEACGLQIGEGRGVSIDDVIADSGADGVLVVGDLLVGINGQAITNADELRTALGRQHVGDEVSVDVIRDGKPVTAAITLGPNPDAPERPLLGVMIVTDFETVAPGDIEPVSDSGRLSRAIGIGPSIFILDPVTTSWSTLGVEPPVSAWVAAGEAAVSLENPATEESALVDTTSRDRLVFDVGDWWAVSILGTFGTDVVVAGARLIEGQTDLAELAVIAVDFDRRAVEWIWQVNQEIGLPVGSFPSPDGSRLLVAGQSQEDQLFRYVIVSSNGQAVVGPATLSAAEGALALGWYDNARILVTTDDGTLQLIDVSTGVASDATLPPTLGSVSRLTTVGDGNHLLAQSGNSLVKVRLDGTTEIRTLADHCQIGLIGNPGWALGD